MGYLAALAAGVKPIVTPQRFHLDSVRDNSIFCRTIKDFIKALQEIQREKEQTVQSVSSWTWENYAKSI